MGEGKLSIPTLIGNQQSQAEIMACNEITSDYYLQLSKEEASMLLATRSEALSKNDRVEFGGGIITKIIMAFKDSDYISQYNYAITISDLIETFYYYKNETLDLISDDDLIELMRELFDKRCHGSIDLLQNRELERISHNVKYGIWDFDKVEEIDEGEYEDEY